jgi:hypothetical protein
MMMRSSIRFALLFAVFVIWSKVAEALRTCFINSSLRSSTANYDTIPGTPASFALAGSAADEYSPLLKQVTLTGTENISTLISMSETMDFILQEHKPLGCTIEESLVPASDNERSEYLPVFISKLVSGGNGEMVGLKVGDVITGVSAVFGDVVQDTSTLGLYKLQSLVSGRQPEKPLIIRVLRGTDLLQRHEDALMELCMNPTGDESSWGSCVLTSIYSFEDNEKDEEEAGILPCVASEDESECLLTAIWGEEHLFMVEEGSIAISGELASEEQQLSFEPQEPKDSAPWGSRSLTSGTYDPNSKS